MLGIYEKRKKGGKINNFSTSVRVSECERNEIMNKRVNGMKNVKK